MAKPLSFYGDAFATCLFELHLPLSVPFPGESKPRITEFSVIYCHRHWTVCHWRFAHHYKCHCIENYWHCHRGCYSCVSINKHSASKRHSRINSKSTAFCETKITPCCALKVPSASCRVPAVTSQGPCLPLKGKKHVWLQKPWGSSLSLQDGDSEKLGPTCKYIVSNSARSPKSADPLRAMKIPGKMWAPIWTLLSL